MPAVIYGGKQPPDTIALDGNELKKLYDTGHFLSTVYEISVDGAKQRVLPRDLQLDPVKDHIIHVDFLRVTRGSTIAVEVSVDFLNEETCPGLKRGGTLNIVRHEVELNCPADAIPESIQIDLAGFDIGDSIHISHAKLPPNVTPTITDRDFTIASITGTAAARSAEAEGEEGGEDESD